MTGVSGSIKLPGSHGQLLGFLRRAGQALFQGDDPLRQVLDALPVAIYTTDAAGRITYFNEAAAALWGHRPELGKSEWCGSWKLYWPDGRVLPHDQCPLALALKDGAPIREIEALAERPDGSRVPFIPYPTPFFDALGNVTGAVNMLVDISEQKAAERALRQQTHRLETLNRIVKAISMDLCLESIVQTVTDAATDLSGARFGSFFYNVTDTLGERYTLYALSGAPRAAFEKFGLPRNTAIFDPTFHGAGIIRLDDVRSDPR